MFLKKYKPSDYWIKRGKIYYDKFTRDDNTQREENSLIDYLKTIQFESVLEYGCGFGRITKLLLDNFEIKQYKAFDLSSDQINNAKKLCDNYNVDFEVSSIQDYDDLKKYDLVMGVEILMHVPPELITTAVKKLSTFSKKYLINVDYYENQPNTTLAKHNFLHPYEEIYNQLDKTNKVSCIKIDEKQSIFCADF